MTRSEAGKLGAAARNRTRPTSPSVQAVRWAAETGATLSAAALRFGVRVATVSQTWARLYPGLPALKSRRATAVVYHPEDEVTL